MPPAVEPPMSQTAESNPYGYGDAAPDVSIKNNYPNARFARVRTWNPSGSCDPPPFTISNTANNDNNNNNNSIQKYGYEDAPPRRFSQTSPRFHPVGRTASMNTAITSSTSLGLPPSGNRMPRRSSLRQDGAPPRQRRASLGSEIIVRLPGQAEPVKKRRSITFDKKVKVKNVEAVSRLTDTPQHLWFQAEEYELIRRNSWDLVDKVESGQTGYGGRKYCVRGLEKIMHRDDILRTKSQAWDSVLEEQDLQRDQGCWDEEYMASIYKFSTVDAARAAADRGKQDEQEISNYLKSTRRFCRRLSC